MIMQVCSVYDKKIGAYMVPQFFRTKGEAVRAFQDAVASESAPFAKHAEDFLFCRLGSYDDNSGVFENVATAPEIIITAMDCLVKPPVADADERLRDSFKEHPLLGNGKVAL